MNKFGYCFQGQGHSEGSQCQWMFVHMLSSEPQNILFKKIVLWCSIMSQSILHENLSAIFKVKVTERAHVIEIWLFLLYVLNCWILGNQTWYCDPSLWAGVHAKRLVCYVQGQGHSKHAYDQNMTVSTISADLLILLPPNLVWWYIIISQNVLRRNEIVVCKIKGTANFKMLVNVCPDDIFSIAESIFY